MGDVKDIVSTIVAKTDEYLKIPSVVGHEKPLLDRLHREYEDLGYIFGINRRTVSEMLKHLIPPDYHRAKVCG